MSLPQVEEDIFGPPGSSCVFCDLQIHLFSLWYVVLVYTYLYIGDTMFVYTTL